jgi:hypothetical protein
MRAIDLRTTEIPIGHKAIIVSDKVFDFLMNRQNWADIEEPTIAQASEHCGYSVRTMKEDMKKLDCPLRISTHGKQGRGSQTKFHKFSVAQYKKYKEK